MINSQKNTTLKSDDKYKKVFSIIIILYPILNRYASVIPMLTLSETLIFLFLIYSFFKKRIHPVKIFIPFVIYLGFLVVYYIISGSNNEENQDNIGTILRLIFLYVSITFLGKGFINGKFAIKWLNIIAILMVCYVILQSIAAKFGIYLTTYIPGLPIMAEDRDLYILEQQQKYGSTYRAYGLLNEPAALSCYLFLPLAINLFSKINIPDRIRKALFISLGCLICMSSTGILMCGLAWGSFIFFNPSKNTKKYKKYAIAAILLSIIIIPHTVIWETFVERTLGGSLSSIDLQNNTRLNALDVIKDMVTNMNLSNILLGFGMASTIFYLPGFFRVLYTLGLCGFVIVIIQFYYLYRNRNFLQKKLVLFYIILNIGTEILLGNFAVYYLTFILANKKEIY